VRIVRWLHERVTALDLNLMGRFAQRERDRLTSWRTAARHIFGPVGTTLAANRETERTSVCLGGLEVEQFGNNAATITVQSGAILGTHPSPVTETRPGTWSGREEADDYARAMFILPFAATIAPSVPLTVATTDVEWWVVYVTPTVQTVETDSQLRLFNEGTGVFDVSSAAKVQRYKAVPGALRGTPGGAIPDPPAGGVPIAWIRVPAGATTLNDALVFDVRRLLHDAPGPNRIGGQWHTFLDGQAQSPYTETIFRGQAWARLSGELLSVRAFSSAIQMGDLAEPGATWDATATTSAPKIAWLYLAKVKGLVPRPVRRGQSPLGHHASFTNESILVDGALVLSPKPPRLGLADSGSPSKSGLRWDMRASASLSLPSFTRGDVPHEYAGLTALAEEAICVGFYRYVGLNGSSLPILYGSLHVDNDGWMVGRSIASGSDGLNPSGLFALPAITVDNASNPRTATGGTWGFATVTVGGTAHVLPLTAARLLVDATFNNADVPMKLGFEQAGRLWRPYSAGANFRVVETFERRVSTYGEENLAQLIFTLATGNLFDSLAVNLLGVRLPYGEDLVT
jgi:hypothetical protein